MVYGLRREVLMWLVPWVWMGFSVNEMRMGLGCQLLKGGSINGMAAQTRRGFKDRLDKQRTHLDNLPIGHAQEAHTTSFSALQSHDAFISAVPLPHVIDYGDDGTHAPCVDGIPIIPHHNAMHVAALYDLRGRTSLGLRGPNFGRSGLATSIVWVVLGLDTLSSQQMYQSCQAR